MQAGVAVICPFSRPSGIYVAVASVWATFAASASTGTALAAPAAPAGVSVT